MFGGKCGSHKWFLPFTYSSLHWKCIYIYIYVQDMYVCPTESQENKKKIHSQMNTKTSKTKNKTAAQGTLWLGSLGAFTVEALSSPGESSLGTPLGGSFGKVSGWFSAF